MFHVYTAAPRPTLERSHQPHRKTSASTETNPHQQSPKYTQHTPKTGTHGEQAPHIYQCIPPQHTNARIGQRYAEAAHTYKNRGAKPTGQLQSPVALQQHTKSTVSSSPSQRTRTSPSAISPTTPGEPGSPKANPEHPNSKGTKVVIM